MVHHALVLEIIFADIRQIIGKRLARTAFFLKQLPVKNLNDGIVDGFGMDRVILDQHTLLVITPFVVMPCPVIIVPVIISLAQGEQEIDLGLIGRPGAVLNPVFHFLQLLITEAIGLEVCQAPVGFAVIGFYADAVMVGLDRLFRPAHLHQYRAQQSQHVDVFRVAFNGFPANGLGSSRVAGVDQLERFIEYGFGGINLSHNQWTWHKPSST